MRVILCGYHWTGCKALMELLDMGAEVFVYTHSADHDVPDLEQLCRKMNVSYTTDKIKADNLPFVPDFIASIYYRYIISQAVIDKANGKIFNLHPALLPKYRGCSSVTWALINGEKQYGFTYHMIEAGCDTGNILLQKSLPIEDWDTNFTLYYRVMFEAMNSFRQVVEMVLKGEKGIKQVGESSSYSRGCPYNGEIDDSWPLDKIERFIRAMYFPPYPPAKYKGKDVRSIDEYLTYKEE